MYTLPKNHVLLLKTVNEDMSSYDGFVRKALIGYVGVDIEAGVIYGVKNEKFVKV